MRYNTALRNDDITKELVQLFVVPDGQLQVARYDTRNESISLHVNIGKIEFINLKAK